MKQGVLFVVLLGVLPVFSVTRYVSVATGSDANAPFILPGAPAETIQAAVDASSKGDLILVASGTYDSGGDTTPGGSLFNRVMIDKDITVRSAYSHGAVIQGSTKTSTARCVYMSAGRLENFVLENGTTAVSGDTQLDRSGGGVYVSGSSASVVGCRIEDCSATYRGGGAYGGRLTDCQISGCSASSYGGGSAYVELTDCTVSSNSAPRGGGCYYGSGEGCLIEYNSASLYGGGCYGSDLRTCRVVGNSSSQAGGCYDGELYGCLLRGNRATSSASGGGARNATLNTCVVIENSSGCSFSDMYFCTVAYNDGAGVNGGSLENCIVVENDSYNVSNATVQNVCSPDVTHGVSGCFTNAPQFDGMALRLRSDSPCIDAGEFITVARLIDYDGISRPRDGDGAGSPATQYDVGAFEFCSEAVDTDFDGLSDYAEAWVYRTDPSNVDTDGDGREDGDEVAEGFCPTLNESGAVALGEENVTSSPNSYGLYTSQSVYDANLGELTFSAAGNSVQLQMTPRTDGGSSEAFSWSLSTTGNSAFYRVEAE